MKQSVSGPQCSQLLCLLHSANCQFAIFLNLEKGLLVLLFRREQVQKNISRKGKNFVQFVELNLSEIENLHVYNSKSSVHLEI